MFATLRCTKTSPGFSPVIWFAGTRESEQPIHRYSGFWTSARPGKKSGSSAVMRAAQFRFFSIKCCKSDIKGGGIVDKHHGAQPACAIVGSGREARYSVIRR